MKIHLLFLLIGGVFAKGLSGQNTDTTFKKNAPNIMLDVSYSNQFAFLNSDAKIAYGNGTVLCKLNTDVEMSLMGSLTRDPKFKRNKLFGGLGLNFSEYQINRDLYTEPQGAGHFPVYYTYSPNKLEYRLRLFRINIQLDHFGFYKRWLLFQKFGLAYSIFNKTSPDATLYQEQYGSSSPVRDPAHVTPDNPEGWYFDGDYTTNTKNDLDIFNNGISVFYKFGIGYRIQRFTPTLGFEFSYLSGKFASTYLKFQVGVNYAFLKK